jgi:hypothetical protein
VQRQRPRCVGVRKDGSQCTQYVLKPEGVQSLLDKGHSLVPDAGKYCSFHARSEDDRARMQRSGGAWSPKKQAQARQQRELLPDPMPRQFKYASYKLIASLLDAKIPNTFPAEPDARKQMLGAYLAALAYAQPEERGHRMYQLVNRELRQRQEIAETAETQLRDVIFGLDREEQKIAWEIVGAS